MSGIVRKAVPYGWCPTAYRPMMADDGYLLRIRPFLSRLTAEQVLRLCDLAQELGNGQIEFTIRSNLQFRGVTDETHEAFLKALAEMGLLDVDAAYEHRRNLLITPFWHADDLTTQVHAALLPRLGDLPELPAKMGVSLDCSGARNVAAASADFRFECDADGGLILRADGAELGRSVTFDTAADALVEMAEWFMSSGGAENGRMARHLAVTSLPADWAQKAPAPTAPEAQIGTTDFGLLCAAPAGAHQARDLADLVQQSGAKALRTTPWRAFLLEGADETALADPAHPWKEHPPVQPSATATA